MTVNNSIFKGDYFKLKFQMLGEISIGSHIRNYSLDVIVELLSEKWFFLRSIQVVHI